jgi:dual specificity tyrosine-phosphorylation-regulated kinase 2/3/4
MCNAAVLTTHQMVPAMPLSRTRSLLSNINGNHPDSAASGQSYLPHLGSGDLKSSAGLVERLNPSMVERNGSVEPASLPNLNLRSAATAAPDSPPLVKTSSTSSTSSSNGSNQQAAAAAPAAKPKTMVATPEQVAKLYLSKLTPYEHHEIFNYPQIYFIGANAKKRPGIIGSGNNCGYDNEQGSYIHIPHDHIAYRYEVLRVIGKGSFGQVVKAYDHKLHQHVALKMVRNEKRFHRQAQEEIRILEHLRKQDKDNTMNIIHMYDNFTFRSHMCITFELLSINLYELIKKNKFQGFSLQLVRKFAHSLLQCLDALHRNKIIHCDMKPENVLLKQQGRSGIKVGTCFFSLLTKKIKPVFTPAKLCVIRENKKMPRNGKKYA